ncbi:mechanosensitive ion channel [Sphingobacterium olei]|uniref:Mechanosensitive ion channel n=1 Tax=Sphingobacterium olei TaxID=2571155 RepID=A0A4V5MK10_9SPHI|nr:mechanosensitive ion channel domain-containing protein [Sphingobacterium olei]TJZ51428.1 mechanosensitive ion channel [Sphingobacterium olei]
MKEKNNLLYGCVLSAILLFGIAFTVGQEQKITDTTENADGSEIVEVPKATETKEWKSVEGLRIRIGSFITQVDSLKRDQQLRQREGRMDSAFVDSVYRQLNRISSGIDKSKIDILLVEKSLLQKKSTGSIEDSLVERLATEDLLDSITYVALTDSLSVLNARLDLLKREIQIMDVAFKTASPLLTEAADSVIMDEIPLLQRRIIGNVKKNLARDQANIAYFDYSAWSSRLFLILLSGLYFYWIFRLGRRSNDEKDEINIHKNDPLWIPILKAVVFFLTLLPLVSFVVPILVLEVSYFIIFVLLLVILYEQLTPYKKRALGLTSLHYALLIIANLVIADDPWTRIFAGTMCAFGIYLIYTVGKKINVENPVAYVNIYARWAIILVYILSILSNVIGYIEFARMWGSVAAIALLQALSLRAFRDMLLHDLEKQFEVAPTDHVIKRFDLPKMRKALGRVLYVCCTIIVIVVLVNSLNINDQVSKLLDHIFNNERKMGTMTYTYGNVLLAIGVLATAHWFQKSLNSLLNDPVSYTVPVRRMTLFPLVRLLIVVVGFLIAVSIIGIGTDRLTVIIGALSVGIGLGLQNIINNFVSGIILVFEKPFKIGDYIELADKKGQVLEIGIRSSTLMTDQGARVIIPNGDLLSGRLVNWTFLNDDIRLNMELTITGAKEIEPVKSMLTQKLDAHKYVDQHIPIKVYTKSVNADNYVLAIQIGMLNVQHIERFKSEFLEDVKKELKGQEIGVASTA